MWRLLAVAAVEGETVMERLVRGKKVVFVYRASTWSETSV
jgi:hypothetical protein